MSLSTQPYKGARDFYPPDKRLQKYIFSKWRAVVERFGYEEYDAPIIESLDIYKAKTGQEIVDEQTYVFTDRGSREVAIRPEMTPSVSRMVAAKRQELAYPLRWYSIPNLWRYERPQRGRLREHYQLNVDIFGVKDISAELEMITLVDAIFQEFGASSELYEIRLNHRQLSEYFLRDLLKLDKTTAVAVSRLIDRYHKLELSNFIARLDDVLSAELRKSNINERILSFLAAKNLSDLPKEAQDQPAAKDLSSVLATLKKSGIEHARFDPTLMRGFDYYNGIVFEVFDTDPVNSRSMVGGGRYDGLVGLFGVEPLPTVGFGWGDVTLINFLETHHLLPDLKSETSLYVALIGDVFSASQATLAKLRQAGLNLAVDLSKKKLGDQLKTADKKGLELVLIIGDNELAAGLYKLKDLNSGQEESLDINGIIKKLKGR